jgi:hypothetical protein
MRRCQIDTPLQGEANAAYADKYDVAIVFANVAGFAQESTVRIHWFTWRPRSPGSVRSDLGTPLSDLILRSFERPTSCDYPVST